MSSAAGSDAGYLARLGQAIDEGWRWFWFAPRDPLGVAVLRLVTGLMSLYYIASFSFDLVFWFGPGGLLNRASLERLTSGFGQETPYRFSLFQVSDDPTFLWLVHGTALLVAVAFTLGLFTRWMNAALLVVLLSYVHRAPMITGQFEPVLTMLVAYLCLTPSGAALSLDAKRRGTAANGAPLLEASVAANVGQRLIQVHLAAFYALIGLSMAAGQTWWSGDAVWWLMAHSESRLVDVTALGHTDVGLFAINFLTHATVAVMLLYPILIWRPLARPLLIAAATVIWTLLAFFTGLVGYALLMIVAQLAFAQPATLRRWFGPARGTRAERAAD